jgi:hypothetical protein
LIHLHTGRDQCMAESVGVLIQFGVALLLIEASGGDTLRMRGNLRFEQRNVALLQRIFMRTLVATMEQEVLFLAPSSGRSAMSPWKPSTSASSRRLNSPSMRSMVDSSK